MKNFGAYCQTTVPIFMDHLVEKWGAGGESSSHKPLVDTFKFE